MYLCVGKNGYYAVTNDLNMVDTYVLAVFEINENFEIPAMSYPVIMEDNSVEWFSILHGMKNEEQSSNFVIKSMIDDI